MKREFSIKQLLGIAAGIAIFSSNLAAWNISVSKEPVKDIYAKKVHTSKVKLSSSPFSYYNPQSLEQKKSPKYIKINYRRKKTFHHPGDKISKWIYFRNSEGKLKMYGSILVKAKGTKGVAYYLIRVWDGHKYYFKTIGKWRIKKGQKIFEFKDKKNGLTYTVKVSPNSYYSKTLIVEIKGQVINPDYLEY